MDDLILADIDTFVRLLTERSRTYVDLIAITGVSFRTAKERMREIRRKHVVEEVFLPGMPGVSGRGPVLMRVLQPGKDSDPWTPRPGEDVVDTACPAKTHLSSCRCRGTGRIVFSRAEWTKRRASQRSRYKAAAR